MAYDFAVLVGYIAQAREDAVGQVVFFSALESDMISSWSRLLPSLSPSGATPSPRACHSYESYCWSTLGDSENTQRNFDCGPFLPLEYESQEAH